MQSIFPRSLALAQRALTGARLRRNHVPASASERSFASVCDVCLRPARGEVTRDDQRVLHRKRCTDHGVRELLVSLNGEAHLRLDAAYHTLFPPDEAPPAPVDTYFFVTNRCNQSCEYCAFEANRHEYFGDFDEAGFAAALEAFRGPKVGLIGGEPAVHEDFFRFVELIAQANKTVVVYTNGIRFAEEAFVRRLVELAPRLEVRMTFEGFSDAGYQGLGVRRLRERKLAALANLEKYDVVTVLGHTADVGDDPEQVRHHIRAVVEYAMSHDFVRGLTFQSVAALGGTRGANSSELLSVDRVMDRVAEALSDSISRREAYVAQKLVYFMARTFRLPICSYVQAAVLFRQGGRWVGLDHFFDTEALDRRLDRRVRSWRWVRHAPALFMGWDVLACARPRSLPAVLSIGAQLTRYYLTSYDFATIPKSILPLVAITVCDAHNWDSSVSRRCEKGVHSVGTSGVVQELCSEMALRLLRERQTGERS